MYGLTNRWFPILRIEDTKIQHVQKFKYLASIDKKSDTEIRRTVRAKMPSKN